MRKEYTIPAYGRTRKITKFLFWPLEISQGRTTTGQKIQSRWLETVTIEQKYTKGRCGDFWKNIRFV